VRFSGEAGANGVCVSDAAALGPDELRFLRELPEA